MTSSLDRYEEMWRDMWRETHTPDENGDYYFDRQDAAERGGDQQ